MQYDVYQIIDGQPVLYAQQWTLPIPFSFPQWAHLFSSANYHIFRQETADVCHDSGTLFLLKRRTL